MTIIQKGEPMSDLIDRQAAIDALRRAEALTRAFGYHNVIDTIRELPSAQPEPCEDAVSRKTILKFLDDWMSALEDNVHNQSASDLKIIKRDFANLPPVTPKQRTGKWIDVDVMGMPAQACDQCKTFFPLAYTGGGHHYCPNCGAKMEGEQDE